MDWALIQQRESDIDSTVAKRKTTQRRHSLSLELENFLELLPPSPTIASVGPVDLRKFLIHKDTMGRTQVHDVQCQFLGQVGLKSCNCPVRLASSYVSNIISLLKDIFERNGRGRTWDVKLWDGNPACAPIITDYLKVMKEEQAKAHILPKQAKPLFVSKLRAISDFISQRLICTFDPCDTYILARDRALFLAQFFVGGRASDMSNILIQEITVLHKDNSVAIRSTFGKTLRGGDGDYHVLMLKPLPDVRICPVSALRSYVMLATALGIQMEKGPLFREVHPGVGVSSIPIQYSSIRNNLRGYLIHLGIFEGETPHSIRSGHTVTVSLGPSQLGPESVAAHVGWRSTAAVRHYSRSRVLKDAVVLASSVANSIKDDGLAESLFNRMGAK